MTEISLNNNGGRKLVCKDCHRAFSKAEHLRRHERSHTGSKPFVCKSCRRPFARQDALTRHERLHTRRESNNKRAFQSPSTPVSGPAIGDNTLPPWSAGGGHTHAANEQQTWTAESGPGEPSAGLQNASPATELDFALIWPDSEDLFQTIMSSDVTDQWQIPLGTLPFPPIAQQMGNGSGVNFDSPSSFDDRGSSIGAIPSCGGHQAVRDVSEMVTSSSSSVTAAVKATSITSVFLDECLHMFFVRFIPTFPILHRATFVFRECTHPLLLNAIAIGSLYLGPKDSIAKGEALWRLAHTAVATSWQTLISHRGPYDACKGVQLLLTALLGQIYGALSKNRAIRTTSQIFRALGFFWARHCGMFDSEPYCLDNLPSPNAPPAEKERQWRIWASREIQQRALLAHYILDGLVSQMSGDSTSVRHVANQLGPPSSEAAFEAGTADEWLVHMRSSSNMTTDQRLSFRLVFRQLFSPPGGGSLPLQQHAFSAFSLRVILEGLQSLVSDCDDEEGDAIVAVGVPVRSDVRRALLQVHDNIITMNMHLSTPERLEILLRWHTICLDTVINSSLLCRYICASYNISQHLSPPAGKAMKSGFDLVKWANTEDARMALLHAVAIQDIVEQLPRGRAHVIHMPSSLFAAATVYIVFSLAGVTTVNLPRTIVWQDVLFPKTESGIGLGGLGTSAMDSETKRYIRGERSPSGTPGTTRNLLYELNSMQKLFRCLSSQWGIAHDMEDIVDQWIALCH